MPADRCSSFHLWRISRQHQMLCSYKHTCYVGACKHAPIDLCSISTYTCISNIICTCPTPWINCSFQCSAREIPAFQEVKGLMSILRSDHYTKTQVSSPRSSPHNSAFPRSSSKAVISVWPLSRAAESAVSPSLSLRSMLAPLLSWSSSMRTCQTHNASNSL